MMKKLTTRTCLLLGVVLGISSLRQTTFGEERPQKGSPAASHVPEGRKVFYASHSLMWYVPAPLGELAAAAGSTDHSLVGLQRIGASRTLQHWEIPEPQNQAKRALETGKLDVFVMSPIQFPDEGIENFVKLGLEHNPKMRFIVQLSWGGGDTDNQDFPKGAWSNVDRNKTPEQLKKLNERNVRAGEAQADAINKTYGQGKQILALVPTAQALVALRTKIFHKQMPGLNSQGELFVDAAHPSAPLEALNTYLHYAVIYRQSPVGLPMPGVLKNAKNSSWNEEFNRTLQDIAWETVTHYPHAGVKVGATSSMPSPQ
jgi:hypothetical protein